MSTPDVSILVVGFSSASHLPACFDGISRGAAGSRHEVLFVNNGSDGSERLVAQICPSARILPSKGNIGFASGNNYLAQEARGTWLLLLNPDTELQPGAIDKLLELARTNDDRFGIIGGATLGADGAIQSATQQRFPSLDSYLRMIIGLPVATPELEDTTGIRECDAVSGAFMLVDTRLWRELGGMDESFFLYSEELDLCWRARKAGCLVGVAPEARARHDLGSGAPLSPRRMMFSMRGSAHFYRKHYPPLTAAGFALLHWLTCCTRLLAGLLLAPFSAKARLRVATFARPCLQPWRWMRGYASPGADPRRAPQQVATAIEK